MDTDFRDNLHVIERRIDVLQRDMQHSQTSLTDLTRRFDTFDAKTETKLDTITESIHAIQMEARERNHDVRLENWKAAGIAGIVATLLQIIGWRAQQ